MRTLLAMSLSAAINSIPNSIEDAEKLPLHLKARLFHLMSKRNGLIDDDTLPRMCTPSMRELDFTNSFAVSDAGLCKLPRCNYLWKLDLNATGNAVRPSITSVSIIHISQNCPFLRIVYLRRCVSLTDDGIISLAENCKHLVELNLSGCLKISDKAVEAISTHSTKLTNLNLAYTKVSDEGAMSIAKSVFAQNLQELQLAHCMQITDEAVEAILIYCTNVTYLEIQDCPNITSQSVLAMEEIRDRHGLKQINYTIPWK